MGAGFESERREFVKLRSELTVRYKFLSREFELDDKIREGVTSNLGGGGVLLIGQVPEAAWYAELLKERIVLGLNIVIPSEAEPVKTLGTCAWLEAAPDAPGRVGMGVKFKEIDRPARDALLRYIIRAQLR